jgi:saccharopine dehydrogenase-like NADP-dependent oxidoreductase
MQGKIVSKDLLECGYSVLMCGRDRSRIEHLLDRYDKNDFKYVDARERFKMKRAIKKSGAKVVVNCMEGDWNLNALKACIKARADYIDLGSEIWMTEKQFELDETLKKKNLISITGIGSVPGIGNVMLRYAGEKFDSIESIDAGFVWESNLKKFTVPFSMESIIEEFSDPAPVVENGKFVNKVPMETIKYVKRNGIEKQKEFNVRHPEQYTFYKYYKNKGVKNIRFFAGFPDHSFDFIVSLIESGLSSKEEINFFGTKIKPINFLTQALKNLKYPEGYTEKENLWVEINGKKNGKNKKILMECLVPPKKGWEDAGCNIDTGMPASILAQMIKKNIITEKGSFSPEGVVPPKPFFKELRKRGMKVYENGKVIN